MKKFKHLEPIAFYEALEEQPQRASYKRVVEMLDYLRRKGYKIEAFKRYDRPIWHIKSNHWYWVCNTNKEAFNHLYPFYYEEKQKDYGEYMRNRAEKLRKEMAEERKKAHEKIEATKLL